MGVLNVTPDSFGDAIHLSDPSRAIDAALRMEAEGADLIDIGGESTRPGADPVSAADEMARVLPVLRGLAGRLTVPISVDTYKADVARAAMDAGAAIVNDVSGLRYDPALARAVADAGGALIVMHTRGRPKLMYAEAVYKDVIGEIATELGITTGGSKSQLFKARAKLRRLLAPLVESTAVRPIDRSAERTYGSHAGGYGGYAER